MRGVYKGFTLIEITLVMVLISILIAITIPLVSSVITRNDLGTAHESLYTTLLRAQQLSKTNYKNSQWRVCIDNATKIYTITAGTCSDTLYPESIKISPDITVNSSQTLDIAFKPINGELDYNEDFIIVNLSGGGVSKSILINQSGIIAKEASIDLASNIPTPAPTIVQNGLILHLDAGDLESYPGDGTSWFNLSNNSYTFTLRNNPIYSSDNGGSFYFNGTSDAHINPPITTVTQNVSMQVWVNIEDTSRKGFFFHNGSNSEGYGFGVGNNTLDSSGNELIGLYDNRRWIDTNTNLGTGWKFVTMVIDSSGNPTFYINNTSLGTFEGVTPLAPGSFTNVASDEANRKFTGNIGQVYFYNTALTSSEVQQNYDVTKSRFGL